MFFASCSVGPAYVAPALEIPAEWKNKTEQNDDLPIENPEFTCPEKWWYVFEDETLNELEVLALENNRNLFVAFERIEEARALMGIAAANFYPQITLNPLFSDTRQLTENYNLNSTSTSGSSALGTLASAVTSKFFRENVLLYFLPFNFSYEVDLWGKIRDGYDAASYDMFAQQKDYEAVMLNLTTSLATCYYQLRSADNQIDLLLKVYQTRQKAFDINNDRYEQEISDYSDVSLAGQELDSVLGQYLEVKRQREVLENQIAVLIGVPASEFSLEHLPLQGLPPEIPGIPSEVLLRRPDIAEAEFEVKSEHALVKQVYTEFFPSLNLTAASGLESPVLKYFLSTVARYWMDSVQMNQLVFDGGRTTNNLNLQIARFKEASGNYQQLVLIAFQEVEDSLANISSYAEQYRTAQATTEWAKKAISSIMTGIYQASAIISMWLTRKGTC